jgi:hypothetical protein
VLEEGVEVSFPSQGEHAFGLPGGARGEPDAALGAPAVENLAAGVGAHAGTEAVGPQAAAAMGLEGALHGVLLFDISDLRSQT